MYGRQALGAVFIALVLSTPVARAVDQKDVDAAVERGVAALKQMGRGGKQNYPHSGATSLTGLALVECGVDTDDRLVQAAADYVRQDSIAVTHTYSIALAIVFLDRLGDPADVALIESLMIRLMAGQASNGGWGYQCPRIAESEVTRLRTHLKNRNVLKGGTGLPGKKTVNDLTPEIRQQLALVNRQVGAPGGGGGGGGASDNSNTQFATLAMWVGRRHGFPVENALGRIDTHFRMSQHNDGTWSYLSNPGRVSGAGTATMTCAGALGLAVSLGAMHDPDVKRGRAAPDPLKDMSLQKALLALGHSIGGPIVPINDRNGKSYYFLWSLERLAVALNLETIGKVRWYDWGAEVLLANQRKDGTWRGDFGDSGADTAFALLFLRRANLMKDLSSNLRGKLKDPATVELRKGGVGGIGLPGVGKNVRPALGPEGKQPEDPRPKEPPVMKPLLAKVENSEAAELSNKFLEAKGADQDKVLKELRDTKGAEYTEALALSIPRLQGEQRENTRDALAERLRRMSAAQLEKYLKDENPEVRRGAANATYMKDVLSHIPLLIECLNDNDAGVARTAHVALKQMTKQDFGPDLGATRDEHDKAIEDWKDWWKKQKK